MDRMQLEKKSSPNGSAMNQNAVSEVELLGGLGTILANGIESPAAPHTHERQSWSLTPEQLKLRNAVMIAHEQLGVRSLLVTSLEEGAGVTSVCVALARGLSWDQRHKVLLVEANLYRPCLQELFDLRAKEEIIASFEARSFLNLAAAVGPPNLHVIAAGELNRDFAMEPRRLAAALPGLHEAFDFIIIDAPPANLNPEFVLLSAHVDRAILVMEAGRTRMHEVEAMIEELARAKAKLLGVVLNREDDHLPAMIEKWF